MSGIALLDVNENSSTTDRTLDIIFVHGLGGDARDTWQIAGMPNSFWPSWISADFSQARVTTLSYAAGATRWTRDASSMGLLERSRNILDFLSLSGIGERPVIFVCHSLGGLMVKQLLYTASSMGNRDWQPIADQCKAVIFLATPHTGSGISQVATFFSALTRATRVTEDLAEGSKELQHLGDWFRNFASAAKILVSCYHETAKLAGVTVVDSVSGNPGIAGCTPVGIDADHVSICKPTSRNELVYLGSVRTIRRIFDELSAPPKRMRVYLVPGYTNDLQKLRSAFQNSTEWAETLFAEDDPLRMAYGLPRYFEDASICHVFILDLEECFKISGNFERTIELIQQIRSLGRGLALKPIVVLFRSDNDTVLMGNLNETKREALESYFKISKGSLELLGPQLSQLRPKLANEWAARPKSSYKVL